MDVVELLVHVSEKQQDDHYRRMTAAYEEFEIESVIDVSLHIQQEHTSRDDANLARREPLGTTNGPSPRPITPLTPYTAPLLFTNLSSYLATGASRVNGEDIAIAQDSLLKTTKGYSQSRNNSGASALAALQSQLWTSSLAAQAYEENDAHPEELQVSPVANAVILVKEATRAGLKDLIAPLAVDGAEDEVSSSVISSGINSVNGGEHEIDTSEERHVDAVMIEDSLNLQRKRRIDMVSEHESTAISSESANPAESLGAASAATKRARAQPDFLDELSDPRADETPTGRRPHQLYDHGSTLRAQSRTRSATKPMTVQSSFPKALSVTARAAPARDPASTTIVPGHTAAPPATTEPASPALVSTAAKADAIMPHAELSPAQRLHESVAVDSKSAHFRMTRAASPPISLAAGPPFTISEETCSHVTQPLEHLYKRFSAVQPPRFVPILQTRPLRRQERGYWHVPAAVTTQIWDKQLLRDFWTFLEDFISTGQAGWGVSCVRVPSAQESGQSAGITSNSELDAVATGVCDCRIYCWGEVIEHIWYLLFVASKSKVKNAGLPWIDGAGKIVVQMP